MTSGNHQPLSPKRVVPARPPRRAPRRALRALTAVTLAVAVGLLSVAPALAAPDGDNDGGLWYYTKTGIADLHAQGITGQGVTVAVIDSPINPTVPELQGANLTIHEPSYCQDSGPNGQPNGEYLPATGQSSDARHGTDMTSLIIGNGDGGGGRPGIQGVAPQVQMLFYATLFSHGIEGVWGCSDLDSTAAAMEQAITDGAQIISVSLSEGGNALSQAVAHAEGLGIVVVNGVSNERGTAPFTTSNGALTMQRAGTDGQLDPDNAFGSEYIDLVGPGKDILGYAVDGGGAWTHDLGTGTSDATAITAGVLALVMSAHPGITANQALQAVLRNTSEGNGDLVLDPSGMTGYGILDPAAAVASDPSQYPDVNPLITDDPLARPLKADINAWAAQAGRTEPSATPTPTEPMPSPTGSVAATGPSDAGSSSTTIWIALASVIAAAGSATLVGILNRNRKQAVVPAVAYPTSPGPNPPNVAPPQLWEQPPQPHPQPWQQSPQQPPPPQQLPPHTPPSPGGSQ